MASLVHRGTRGGKACFQRQKELVETLSRARLAIAVSENDAEIGAFIHS